ncbi:peptide deformylase, mitochondrial [Microplitis demolitor]|uniref:peptide deformylase, mitochondrial n=1 Tax=Microplitis demolitor TaxID=69319 RepID=UPI0004CD3B41|nr:peptide deformylase, mitochondrial [Microplitis demolitor]
MIKLINKSSLLLNNVINQVGIVRHLSKFVGFEGKVYEYLQPRSIVKPPYHHVCQIGDPVLRSAAESIELEIIRTAEFKKFVDHLIKVMRTYDGFGMSAPQIGVSSQIFVIETTKKQYNEMILEKTAGQPVEEVPLTVFINPTVKVTDFSITQYPECCASICGLMANVPRAKGIQIKALDINGDPFTWDAVGWPAKIAQHEFDHLQGKLYTDIMDRKSLSCAVWEAVNRRAGKVSIDYYPVARSRLRRLFFT